MVELRIVRYCSERKGEWDDFVSRAKNATFLFLRDYMDYHSDRFDDCSLMLYDADRLCALFPANFFVDEGVVASHAGLTYGGLLLLPDAHAADVLRMMSDIAAWYKDRLSAQSLIYKPLPYIYAVVPAEEDLYALFRLGASLKGRSISTVVEGGAALPLSKLRRRGVALARKSGLKVVFSSSEDVYADFWDVLSEVLFERHSCRPVHSLEEILLLRSRFPDNIKLYVAYRDAELLAGVVVYETSRVAHFQYIASSSEGRSVGALDMLISYLIDEVYCDKSFVDFGISTEQGGRLLNEGLLSQKEGFGGRAVVYDCYELVL